jgi:SHAQKYF class myb-like DNA-binding protein
MSIFNENENISYFFPNCVNEIILPNNINESFNELLYDLKEEPKPKQPIKFVLTKQSPPYDTTFLQKKTPKKVNVSNSDLEDVNNGRWNKEEQNRFAEAVLKFGNDWKKIQNYVFSRNITQIRSHAQKFLMKLKENKFVKDKGFVNNLSWTKVMNYLNKTLSYDELKELLFSVEKLGEKKNGKKNYKNLKKIKKNNKNKEKTEYSMNDSPTNSISETNNSNSYYLEYDKDGNNNYNNFNLNEEDKYIINNKLSKQEEEDKEILQKIIECFNPSSDNITLNTSFEESSFKKDENNIEYKLLNESNYI